MDGRDDKTPSNISNVSTKSKEDQSPQNDENASDWKLNHRVMVRWNDGVRYEGKIIRVFTDDNDHNSYRVTFRNWGIAYDETYTHDEALDKFEAYTPEYAKECEVEFKKRLALETGSSKKKRKASKGISDVTPSKRLATEAPSSSAQIDPSHEQSDETSYVEPVRKLKLPTISAEPNRKSLSSSAPISTPQLNSTYESFQSINTSSNVQPVRHLKLPSRAFSTRESTPSFDQSELFGSQKILVPKRLEAIAVKRCVFPPNHPISEFTTAYLAEIKDGKRLTSSFGEYAEKMEEVIDVMVKDVKATAPYYLLKEEFPAYFELINKNRGERGSLNMDDFVKNDEEEVKDIPDSQGSFRQTLLQKKVHAKYQPDESKLDVVYLLRYLITFGNIGNPITRFYQAFEPIYSDLLDFINATLPEDAYE